MGKSNLIRPDFTEELVGFMIQSMLTVTRFPRAPFALIPLSKKQERIFGADAKIEALCPLYIQFKRSLAYPDFSNAGIIKDRKRMKVNCSPISLYFQLRAKKPSHKDFQHNILYDLKSKLDKNGTGKAFYTAPLFLNRNAYLFAVHTNAILNWRPWRWMWRDPFFFQEQEILTRTGSIRFQNVPSLREHIVIPPHAKVKNHKHKYSYLETGKDICFHEPTILENESNLGQTIYDFLGFSDGQPTTEMIQLEESLELLNSLSENILSDTEQNSNLRIMERWLEFGVKLYEEYEISQYMLVKLKKE